MQPEVLFPRQLALDVGGLDTRAHLTMDYELWGKFLLAGATFQYTHIGIAMFRLHDQQKTATPLGNHPGAGQDRSEARESGAEPA